MKYISRVRLQNFKRFSDYDLELHPDVNILIGDNETGKSSILLAIDLVLTSSRSRIESLGVESLFNTEIIQTFFSSGNKIKDLPILRVELFFSELNDSYYNGRNNSIETECDGLRFLCKPNESLYPEIQALLDESEQNFPFEYYTYSFETFSGSYHTGAKKPLKWVNIDTSSNNGDYAIREYTRSMYEANLTGHEKAKHTNEYRKMKEAYNKKSLKDINVRTETYSFGVKNSSKCNFESDLTVFEDGISIENKGKGKQCFIKASFALSKHGSGHDLVLIEEPENHLSFIHMNKLINTMIQTTGQQKVITTHSPFVASRLDLRNVFILSKSTGAPTTLANVPKDTAEFFMKSPNNNLLEFILSEKTILVEGAAEYILLEAFYEKIYSDKPNTLGIQIISVNGTGFKSYIHVAKLVGSKIAIIRDNDGNYSENIIENYQDLIDVNINIFSDTDDSRSTFEKCIYNDNKEACDDLFLAGRRTLTVQDYMLGNKTETSFEILKYKIENLNIPQYIVDAFTWLNS